MKLDILLKWFNMYCAHTYNESKNFRMHCGEHTVIMKECINSYSFRPMLNDLHERACELWRTQQIVNVVCCCYKGTHRSVAIADSYTHLTQPQHPYL